MFFLRCFEFYFLPNVNHGKYRLLIQFSIWKCVVWGREPFRISFFVAKDSHHFLLDFARNTSRYGSHRLSTKFARLILETNVYSIQNSISVLVASLRFMKRKKMDFKQGSCYCYFFQLLLFIWGLWLKLFRLCTGNVYSYQKNTTKILLFMENHLKTRNQFFVTSAVSPAVFQARVEDTKYKSILRLQVPLPTSYCHLPPE